MFHVKHRSLNLSAFDVVSRETKRRMHRGLALFHVKRHSRHLMAFVPRETLHRKQLRLGDVSRETGAMPQKIFKNFKITIAKFQKVLYNKFTDDNLEVKYIWER